MMPVLSLQSFTGNRNNIDIFLYNLRALPPNEIPSYAPGNYAIRNRINKHRPTTND